MGFFDSFNNLFDINNDGQLDTTEKIAEYIVYNDIVNATEGNDDDILDDLDNDDDLF